MKKIIWTSNNIKFKSLVADSLISRLIGLIGKKQLAENTSLWIPRCNFIHTCFMSYPIDVVFINKKNEIVSIKKNIKPFRFAAPVHKAYSVIEFNSRNDITKKLDIGDKLNVET